jgi:hypothetical protein
VFVPLPDKVPCGRVAGAVAPPGCADVLGGLEPVVGGCAAGSVDAGVEGVFMSRRLWQYQHCMAMTMRVNQMNTLRNRLAMVVICDLQCGGVRLMRYFVGLWLEGDVVWVPVPVPEQFSYHAVES